MITTITNLEQMKQAIEAFNEISEFHFQAMETLLLLEGRVDRMAELQDLIGKVRNIINGSDNLNSENDASLEDILGMKPEEYLPKLTILRKALGSPK